MRWLTCRSQPGPSTRRQMDCPAMNWLPTGIYVLVCPRVFPWCIFRELTLPSLPDQRCRPPCWNEANCRGPRGPVSGADDHWLECILLESRRYVPKIYQNRDLGQNQINCSMMILAFQYVPVAMQLILITMSPSTSVKLLPDMWILGGWFGGTDGTVN